MTKSAAELAARFAPVGSPEEPLAFAVATSRARVLLEVVAPPGSQLHLPHAEPTYVERVGDGFKVRLFEYNACGCAPHDEEAVDFMVTRQGEVTELARQSVYTSADNACAD